MDCKKTTCKGFNEILVSRQRIGCQADKINFPKPNPFSDKIGNNKNIHTTCKAALPSRAGTTKHVYKKRDTKQAQHQEGANNSRAKWITNPCQDDDRHENTTLKYKKGKN